MLAQNFKTAADLGIADKQKRALELALSSLERGECHHVESVKVAGVPGWSLASFSGHFNMTNWRVSTECGTVCCIGGTAELLANLRLHSLEEIADHNLELRDLFYPRAVRAGQWGAITVEQAARALRSYLTTGSARWDEALA